MSTTPPDPHSGMRDPLYPGTGEEATNQQVVRSGAPLPPAARDSQPATDVRRGGSGCLWIISGAFGCLALVFVILLLLVGLGINSVDGILRSFTGIFSPQVRTTNVVLPVIERISALSELTTMRFNYANIVTSSTEMPGVLAALYGDSLVMVAVGHVEAGIDLSSITADDIQYDPVANTFTLDLPAPRLNDCFLNEQESYVVSRATGIFAAPSPALDTESRRFALRQFRDLAIEEGILLDAAREAETVVREFLSLTLVDDNPSIEVVIAVPPADPVYPDTCR